MAGVTRAVETQEIKNGAGTLCDQTVEVFQKFDWGYELVAVTNDPGGANLVTQFTFFSDTNDAATCGKIESIIYPDGYWERREYSAVEWWDSPLFAPVGALVRTVNPWEDTPISAATPDCLVTDYDYNVFDPGSYRLVKWHDPDGEREWYAVEDYIGLIGRADKPAVYSEVAVVLQDPCASQSVVAEMRIVGCIQGYGDWQETSSYSPNAGPVAGQVFSKIYDYAKTSSYDYEFGTWDSGALSFSPNPDPFTPDPGAGTDLRQTVFHGTYNGNGDLLQIGPSGGNIQPVFVEPFRSTKEVRVIKGGNLVARELYVYEGNEANFALIEQVIYQRDALGHATNVVQVDPVTEQSRVIYQADWTGGGNYPVDLKFSETDEQGTVLTHTYDSLKRVASATKQPASGQAAITTAFAYDAANRALTNTLSAGSLSQTTRTQYDLAGRKTAETDPAGLTTTFAYQNGGRQTTITASSGATTVTSKYLDRRVASVTGSAVTNQFYHYTLDATETYSEDMSAPRNVTTIHNGTSNSLRWIATHTDKRNEVIHEVKPAFQNTNVLFKSHRTVYRGHTGEPSFVYETGFEADGERYPGAWSGENGFCTFYDYDMAGERITEVRDGSDAQSWCVANPASTDRTTTFTNYFTTNGQSHFFHVSEKWGYPYDDDATPALMERTKERLTGFTSTQVSESLKFDADTNQTTVLVTVDLANKKVSTLTTVPQSSLTATQVVVNGLVQTESTPTVAATTTHYYDALGREIGVRDPLGNLTGTRFDATTGQVTATTNALGLVSFMQYYPAGGTNAGLLKCLTGPTGKRTYYNYDGSGRLTHIWGDVPYPEKRDYSAFGELVTLTTYRGDAQWTGSSWPANPGTGDVTQWFYDEATGLLTNKTDAVGQAVKYDYYHNHFPKTRVWARGLASTNLYSDNGDLICIAYSDGSSVAFTNEVLTTYDRMARPRMVADATGTNVFTYDHAGRVVATTCTDGLLAGVTVTNHFDPARGRDVLQVTGLSAGLTHRFGYDGYGRLSGVTNGAFWAGYGYLPDSDLLATTTCKSNTTTILTTTRSWETGPRLHGIANFVGANAVSSHDYTYDNLNRRTRAALEDGSYWLYGYNDRNELTGARRYWYDLAAVAGQQFGYEYDCIGNRKTAQLGGDASGTGLRPVGYAVNSLNEYTTITNLGYADVLGAALATNAVWVNGQLAERKGEYFRRELQVGNASGPVWTNVTVASGGVTNTGGLIVPDDRQALTYDLDGNLTFDGTWSYTWDGENRLRTMTMTNAIAGIAASNRLQLEFVYDYMNRRVQKIVSTNSTGNTFVAQSTNRFVYDGWNLIAIVNPPSSIVASFTWGQDLSGTMDDAGGIGGLLLVTSHGGTATNCFVAYDGNGNVTALVKGGSDPIAARYEYSAFGETLRATGPLAKLNPFRFSTKFSDEESGLLYYGWRYYSPELGRWIGRDPIQGMDAINLFAFLRNNSLMSVDPDGRWGYAISVGSAALIGGIIGALTSENAWQGFLRGSLAGATGAALAPFAAAVLGGGTLGVIAAGASAGAVSAYLKGMTENYCAGNSGWYKLSTRQAFMVGTAAVFGALVGAKALKYGDADEATLNWTIGIAGSFGLGAANTFINTAEATARAAMRMGSRIADSYGE